MDRNALRAFVERPWAEVARLDREYWAERHRREGPAATVAASQALWSHMRSVRPDWPDERERAEDLAHHLRLKGLLERAASAFSSR
jgi:hypothetical protein